MDLRLRRQRARDAGDVNDRCLAALRSAERWWLATAASARSQTLARGPTLRRGIEPEPEIRYGSGPVTLLMPFMLGQKKTNELLFTGDVLAADDAERLGLVNAVVARDELESAVQALAALVQDGRAHSAPWSTTIRASTAITPSAFRMSGSRRSP